MRVLITRHDKIGDFVTALPMCKVLKENTSHTVIMLVSKVNVDLAKKLDFIDEVIEYSDSILELARRIKDKRVDISISAYIDSTLGASLFLAGVKTRIAPATKIAQVFFNKTIKQKRSLVEKREWQYNLDLISFFDDSIDLKFKRPLLDLGVIREKYIIFHVGSGGSSDGNLKLDDYIKLAKTISSKIDVVFTFGPDDKEVEKYIKNNVDFKVEFRDNFKSLWEFTKFIAKSSCFISTSTGPMHLAGLTNTPTFSFFGSNLFASSKRWSTISDIKIQNNFELDSEYSNEKYAEIEDRLLACVFK